MEPIVLLLVLGAAVLHASWNALIKVAGDPWIRLSITTGARSLFAFALLPFVPTPAPESWPFLAASVLFYQAYFVFLIQGYRHGDLSQVYPIARGTAPLLVAAGAYLFAGEELTLMGTLAVIMISGAIASLAGRSGAGTGFRKGVTFALCMGVTIAAYTISDGLGVRRAGDVMSYIVWLNAVGGLPFVASVLWFRRRVVVASVRTEWRLGLLGGLLSFTAYGLAIWALNMTSMAYVSALRETGVIVAALIGVRLLKEPFGRRRLIAAACVAAAILVLQMSRTA